VDSLISLKFDTEFDRVTPALR